MLGLKILFKLSSNIAILRVKRLALSDLNT